MPKRIKKLVTHTLTVARHLVYGVLYTLDKTVLKRQNQVFILSYHSVACDSWRFSIDEAVIKRQIRYLHAHYDIITLRTLDAYLQGKVKLTRPSVVLTFDDGYKDILKLKKFFGQLAITPALFLLATPQKPNWKELGSKRPFLTKREIKSLLKLNWEIGCHSATHDNLATLTQKELDIEIIQAKKTLEKDLGIPVPYFAYPRGKYNSQTLLTIKRARFKRAFTMDDGMIKPHMASYTIPRVGIDRTHTFAEFKATFSPSVVQIRKLVKMSPVGRYL